MDPQRIGEETGIESWDAYARSGMILDCYLGGKISLSQARELATFYEAAEVLRRLPDAEVS